MIMMMIMRMMMMKWWRWKKKRRWDSESGMTGDCPSNNPLAHHHDQDDDQDDGDKYFDNFNAPMGECMIQRNKNICEVLTLAFTLFFFSTWFPSKPDPCCFRIYSPFLILCDNWNKRPCPSQEYIENILNKLESQVTWPTLLSLSGTLTSPSQKYIETDVDNFIHTNGVGK